MAKKLLCLGQKGGAMFSRNVGDLERVARLAVGLGILFAGYSFQSYWGYIGIIPIVTAALGWCPLYLPFGINTCRKG